MAWTTPRTFVTAELLTASIFNTHLRDNLNFLRDTLLGSSDLGSNWKISSGRQLFLSDAANVDHGMTGFVATDVYGWLNKRVAANGGLQLYGLSDADAVGMQVVGVIGSNTPSASTPALLFEAYKKSGTGAVALAAGEQLFQWTNGGSYVGRWFGSGLEISAGGGLNVGLDAIPTAATLKVGDSQFILRVDSGTTPAVYWDLADGTRVQYDRTIDSMTFYIAGSAMMSLTTNGLNMGVTAGIKMDGGGAGNAPLGCILWNERADPAAPPANAAYLYCKDNGAGKTQLVALFSSGAVQQVAIQP